MMTKIKVLKLKNSKGMTLELSNLGATIIGLKVPNKNNNLTNVVVSLNAEDYAQDFYTKESLYLGSSVGRYAGRISKGGFLLNNQFYPVHHENGVHLHGGEKGFDKKYWQIENHKKGENPSVTFVCESEHLEEGYPGNLLVKVTYTLTEKNQVKISYTASSDAETHINLTNHAYFNLNGKDSILNHNLQINSKKHLDVDKQLIPSGKLIDSQNSRFDFNKKSIIGRADFEGFDDTFVLGSDDLKIVLESPETGIRMNVYTNQPAAVIYTPKQLPSLPYKDGVTYSKFSAICFETQNFPDSPNNKNFPSSILKPGDSYLNESVFEFSLL
jgi:aldose 1-epimerase